MAEGVKEEGAVPPGARVNRRRRCTTLRLSVGVRLRRCRKRGGRGVGGGKMDE